MNAEALLGALFGLALLAFTGRCLLAWLPAGEPGGHGPRHLAATWAASHLLGWIAFETAGALGEELGLRLHWSWFLAPILGLAAARVATLPAAMSPRHEERGSGAARSRPLRAAIRLAPLAFTIAALLLFDRAVRAGELTWPAEGSGRWRAPRPFEAYALRLMRPAHVAALALLLARALAGFSAGVGPRALVALLWLALPMHWSIAGDGAPASELEGATLQLAFGSGLAFGATWLRRADRRALALSCLAFAHALGSGPEGVALGAAGLLALTLMLHRNAYRLALPWMLLGLVVVALPHELVRMGLELGRCEHPDPSSSWAISELVGALADWRRGGPLWLAAPLGAGLYLARHRQLADRRAAWFAAQATLLALVLHTALAAFGECFPSGVEWSDGPYLALPGAVVLGALALAPADRP